MRRIFHRAAGTVFLVGCLVTTATAAGLPGPATGASPSLSLLPSLKADLPAPVEPAAGVRIGVVDINRITSSTAVGKAAQARMREQQARMQKQVDARKRQLERMKADIERQLPMLSPVQRQTKAREFQRKVEELQKFGLQAEKGLMETQARLLKGVQGAIEAAATTIAKDQGLAAVMVKGELLYLGPAVQPVDISDQVTTLVNGAGGTK